MKILMMEWKSFGNEDIIAGFQELGHEVKTMPFSNKETFINETLQNEIEKTIQDYCPDFIFSFNYFPVISLACKKTGIKYVAWVYDNPYVLLYSYTIIYPGNYVFIFDKELYMEFHQAGIQTIYYLPLAANTDRLSAMSTSNRLDIFNHSKWKNEAEIAFIGSLYTEKHQFYHRLDGISPYTKGYLEGIMASQKNVYGYNFIQEMLTPDIINNLMEILPMEPDPTTIATKEYLYAQYVINRQITAMERTELLAAIGQRHPFDLYTPDNTFNLPGCINHGKVDYYDMAPFVFKNAKINLNITLRSIKSGIPLRAFDILGAGGFLLTNYQADFMDCYVPGEDFIYYENKQDMLSKIDYYLTHEDERIAIAKNGFERTVTNHTYKHRIQEMLSYF